MKLHFEKYQANGNDYILIDSIFINKPINRKNKILLSKKWCVRSYSIGADDVIFIEQSTFADAKITIIEPDGSEADMCGNGIRCVAAYLMDKVAKTSLQIETLAGIKEIVHEGTLYRVNMGIVNMDRTFFKNRYLNFEPEKTLFDIEVNYPEIGRQKGSIIYTGEPNIVFIKSNIVNINIDKWGKNVSLNRELFPIGICTVLVEKIGVDKIKARFFEKGVYKETNSCGTGSTAAAYIANLFFNTNSKRISVYTKGGVIYIEPGNENMNTYMIGAAKHVFSGSINKLEK